MRQDVHTKKVLTPEEAEAREKSVPARVRYTPAEGAALEAKIMSEHPKTLDKSGESGIIKSEDTTIIDAIKSGTVKDSINADLQAPHMEGGRKAIRGFMYGTLDDVEDLYREVRGTGKPVYHPETGEWLHKERIRYHRVIGVIDGEETDKIMIIYSKTGSHIYPRKPGGVD